MDKPNPSALPPLSHEEQERYSRHLALPEIGPQGQQQLKQARVLIVGAGGLGCPAATYLAAGGVGHIGIIDFDRVELSNLQRQPLHGVSQIGQPKTESARARLHDMNPNVHITTYTEQLTHQNAPRLFQQVDLIIDGTDNLPTRYLINDACVLLQKPMIYGAIYRFEGQVAVFDATRGSCYRCLHPTPPARSVVPSCAEAGVLGVLPGLIGCLQASEAIKVLLNLGTSLIDRLLIIDTLRAQFREFTLAKDPHCPVCSENPTITDLTPIESLCARPTDIPEWTIAQLKQQLHDNPDTVTLLDVREPYEYEMRHIPHSLWIPMKEVPARVHELDPSRTTVVMCHSGVRSAWVIADLQANGYTGPLYNLKEGLIAWFTE